MFGRARLTTMPDRKTGGLLALAFSVTVGAVAVAAAWPDHVAGAMVFAVMGVIEVAPLIIPGVLLAAWIVASGADTPIARTFEGRMLTSVVAASAIGAVTPVCGVTVLPLMAGLLGAGVPLAPIMAFWLPSPVIDPAMPAATVATLGISFAVGKTLAAFRPGIFGRPAMAAFSRPP